jgi:hypothetical protein
MLRFSPANSKLKKLYDVPEVKRHLKGRKIYSFDLLSGWSCPSALLCGSKVVVEHGKRKIQDFKGGQFRCFSASQEAVYGNVFSLRKNNFETVKSLSRSVPRLLESLQNALPANAGIVRIHVSGDVFSWNYMLALCGLAKNNQNIWFYAYTKQIPFYLKAIEANLIPDNFRFTMSRGGRHDDLITKHSLKEAIVIFSEEDAIHPIDTNDYMALNNKESFHLVLHGPQAKNTEASRALQQLKTGRSQSSARDKR